MVPVMVTVLLDTMVTFVIRYVLTTVIHKAVKSRVGHVSIVSLDFIAVTVSQSVGSVIMDLATEMMELVLHVQMDIMAVNVMTRVLTVKTIPAIKTMASVQMDAKMDFISFTVMEVALAVVKTAVVGETQHVIHAKLACMEIYVHVNVLLIAKITVINSPERALVAQQTSMERNAKRHARVVCKEFVTRMVAHAHRAVCLDPVVCSARNHVKHLHQMAHATKQRALHMIIRELLNKQAKVNILIYLLLTTNFFIGILCFTEIPNILYSEQWLRPTHSNLLIL